MTADERRGVILDIICARRYETIEIWRLSSMPADGQLKETFCISRCVFRFTLRKVTAEAFG